VREIQRYAEYNENLTFDEFDNVIGSLSASDAKTTLAKFVNRTLPIALDGYINNFTTKGEMTEKQKLNQVGPFNRTLTGLVPGTIYKYKAWVNNSKYMANGSDMLFLTKPESPTNIQVASLGQTNLNLTWSLGLGANTTIIERNTHEAWLLGDGVMIYNGTNNYYYDIGMNPGTRYFYQFWSFTSILDKYQLSPSYSSFDASTQHENRAPVITTIPLTQVAENELYELLLSCTEHDSDHVTWSVQTNASWLNLTGTILSGHPGDLDGGPYYVNITCDDNNGSVVYSNFTLNVIPVPDAPFILKLLDNIEFLEDSFYILDLTGLGADLDGDELTWFFEDVDDDLLDIAKISSEKFNLSGLPDQFGSNRVKLFLEDDSEENLQTFQMLWINVLPVNDPPMQPLILYEITDSDPKTPGNQNLTVSFTAIPPKDVDAEMNFTYSWDFNDDGTVDLTDQNQIKIDHTYPSAGEYVINLTVTDTGGLSNFTKLTLVVTASNTTDDTSDKPQTSSSIGASMYYFGIIGTVIMVIMIKIILMLKRRKHITNQGEQKSQKDDIKKPIQNEKKR